MDGIPATVCPFDRDIAQAEQTSAQPRESVDGLESPEPLTSGDAAQAAHSPDVSGDRETNSLNASAEGEALSVTRLAHFSVGNECRYLASGIDSLDLGISVLWGSDWDLLSDKLDREKERATGSPGIPFLDGRCLILPSGKPPNFRWRLQWPEFHLFLGKSAIPHRKTPNGYVSINSRALWELTVPGVVELVSREIETLGGQIIGIKPSRCDLAADFFVPSDLSLDFLTFHRVPSHVEHTHHMRGDALETFYHGGKSSPTRLRIYSKGLEIAKAGDKWWFLQVWNVASEQHVWRVEFQLRRPTLKAFGIHTMNDLYANLGGLWRYLTGDWFSLRLNDNGNTTRCTTHPWWELVQACAEKFGQVETVQRKFEGEPADSSWYVSHCAGCLASFAACEGIEDFETAIALLLARMENYWHSRDFESAVVKRSIPLGVPGCLGAVESELPSNEKDFVP